MNMGKEKTKKPGGKLPLTPIVRQRIGRKKKATL